MRDDLAAGVLLELTLPELAMFDHCAVIPKGPRRQAVTQIVDCLKALF
ncbi:hypothetical protein P775_14380 [Puniceibacterium antarcticum]|uniref:Uncharacterized protein n=1 Tax=Puniceibacterium antarcticum TaxID=1206336 RepID=A0A2G8RCP5_9RHOB|nr:hypothetical protein [Puniceibacterium antarcticum]PIL19329.1 hypothetical protein P775_14380 [Puniceibacterium antarcticum]